MSNIVPSDKTTYTLTDEAIDIMEKVLQKAFALGIFNPMEVKESNISTHVRAMIDNEEIWKDSTIELKDERKVLLAMILLEIVGSPTTITVSELNELESNIQFN